MSRLFFKELRQLLPFAGLWFCLVVLYYGTELATVRIDEQSYLSWCSDYCDIGTNVDIAIFSILFYLIAAYSLFPREFDDATIDFLRSLPISRASVYLSKIVATCFLICFLLLLEHAIEAFFLSFNTQTLTGKHYWKIDAALFLRGCLFALVIVSHGVFLSWFRTIGLIIYCAYLLILLWIESATGTPAFFSIFEFFDNAYDGQKLVLNWTVINFHLIIAAVLYFFSYFLWTRSDSKPKAKSVSRAARIWPIIISILGFVLVAGWMTTLMQRNANELTLEDISTTETEHYTFVHAVADDNAMAKLLSYAEDDYAALSELLGAETDPVIMVDMTSENEHALGLATWKKIQMKIGSPSEVDPLYRRVLSHETAHVFQAVESERELSKLGNTVGFFIEGMAQYTSFSIVKDEFARNSNWLVSSVAWERQNIRFEQLSNRAVFEASYDPEMLYGIGDIWVEAMSRVCGKESIGQFLRATAREGAPPDLGGTHFWRLTLQHIGCELEAVNASWRKLMQDVLDSRNQLGAFPRYENIQIKRSEESGTIKLSAELNLEDSGALPTQFYIRVKSEARLAASVSPVIRGRTFMDGSKHMVEFSLRSSLFSGQRFNYQLGYTPLPDSRNYYERWRSSSLPNP